MWVFVERFIMCSLFWLMFITVSFQMYNGRHQFALSCLTWETQTLKKSRSCKHSTKVYSPILVAIFVFVSSYISISYFEIFRCIILLLVWNVSTFNFASLTFIFGYCVVCMNKETEYQPVIFLWNTAIID